MASLPDDALVFSRHEARQGRRGADEAQQAQRDGDVLWRVRWLPDARWPLHPWALVAYPWWRRKDADGIDANGELRPLVRAVWDCAVCGASWERGVLCPNCLNRVIESPGSGTPS